MTYRDKTCEYIKNVHGPPRSVIEFVCGNDSAAEDRAKYIIVYPPQNPCDGRRADYCYIVYRSERVLLSTCLSFLLLRPRNVFLVENERPDDLDPPRYVPVRTVSESVYFIIIFFFDFSVCNERVFFFLLLYAAPLGRSRVLYAYNNNAFNGLKIRRVVNVIISRVYKPSVRYIIMLLLQYTTRMADNNI